jgi:hypothetical protein
MSILTNQEKYGKMVEALNNFYWDNDIEPNETAARLEEFAGECVRLAQYIRDNDPALDRAAELPLERNTDTPAAVESEKRFMYGAALGIQNADEDTPLS